jgi:transcriptional regulator with XRE-family HTH domain
VATNLAALRRRRDVTVRGLSERLARLGVSLQPSGITKIEQGQRSVSVDDLVALAVALNVSPARLLLPDAYDDSPAQLTPEVAVPSARSWRWAEGRAALSYCLREQTPDELMADVLAFFDERPVRLRAVEQHRAHKAAAGLALSIERALQRVTDGKGQQAVAEALAIVRRDLERVTVEVEALLDQATAGGDDGER